MNDIGILNRLTVTISWRNLSTFLPGTKNDVKNDQGFLFLFQDYLRHPAGLGPGLISTYLNGMNIKSVII
jgi:hypothetical protein